MPQLEALASSAVVSEHAPDLAQSLQRSLAQRRSAAPRISPAHDMAASAFAVHAFTSDGLARRSKVKPQACLHLHRYAPACIAAIQCPPLRSQACYQLISITDGHQP